MTWDSFEDFKSKYDSRVNPENNVLRLAYFNLCDSIGYQYRSGLFATGTVYNVAGLWITGQWNQFKDIITDYRKTDYPSNLYENRVSN